MLVARIKKSDRAFDIPATFSISLFGSQLSARVRLALAVVAMHTRWVSMDVGYTLVLDSDDDTFHQTVWRSFEEALWIWFSRTTESDGNLKMPLDSLSFDILGWLSLVTHCSNLSKVQFCDGYRTSSQIDHYGLSSVFGSCFLSAEKGQGNWPEKGSCIDCSRVLSPQVQHQLVNAMEQVLLGRNISLDCRRREYWWAFLFFGRCLGRQSHAKLWLWNRGSGLVSV